MAWMPAPNAHPLFTIDAYLTLERTEEERHEYLDGCVYAMAGESPDHGRICVNLTRRLAAQLDGSGCEVFSKDLKVRCGPLPRPGGSLQGLFAYPDLVVVSAARCNSMTRPGMSCSIPGSLWKCCRPPRKPLTGGRSFAAIGPGCRR